MGEGRPQLTKPGGQRGPPPGLAALGFTHDQHQRQREDQPPDGYQQEGNLDRGRTVGKPEPLGMTHHEHIEGKKRPAAQIAEADAHRGYPLVAGRHGNRRQQRIVEHHAGQEGDVAEPIQPQRRLMPAGRHPVQSGGHGDAGQRADRQQGLLQAARVGHGTQQRAQHQGQQGSRGSRDAQPEGAFGRRQVLCPILLEEHRKEGGHHRSGKGRVSDIVKRPGEFATSF